MVGWAGWTAGAVGFTGGAWTAQSVAGWADAIVWLAAATVLPAAVGVPIRSRLPTRVLAVARILPALGIASLVHVASLHRVGSSGSWTVAAVVVAVVMALTLKARRPPAPDATPPLQSPLGPGVVEVTAGGGLLNHHWVARPQAAALDLVLLSKAGTRRCSGAGLSSYASFDQAVRSPCDGVVVRAVDAFGDQVVGKNHPGPPAGNHVLIDGGGYVILLAHLHSGSVTVRAGDLVHAGDLLGRTGNSGNSTEPHLHIHAERDGDPLALRFVGISGPWYRGRRLRAGKDRVLAI